MNTVKYEYSKVAGKNIKNMIFAVESVLKIKENMEVQMLENESTYILQARVKNGNVKKFVGMDKAITVKILEFGNQIIVEVGEQKWIDKCVVLAVSMIVLWPLTITSSIGLYNQKKIVKTIKKTTDNYMESEGTIFKHYSNKIDIKSDKK